MLDLQRLHYFTTVAKCGSLVRAAEMLRVSSPALSKAIHLLETELGMNLFVKNGRNLILTDTGQHFLTRACKLLDDASNLKDDLQNAKPSTEMKIATFEVFSTYFLRALEHLNWDISQLILHEVLPGELERLISERLVDLGITYMPIPHPELDHLKITSIEMGVYTAAHAFEGIPQPDLPFVVPVLPVSGAPSRIRGLDGWPDDAYHRKVKYQVTLMESALQLCRQGLAAGYFPRFIVNLHNEQVAPKFRLVKRNSPYQGRVCTSDVFLVKRKSDLETQKTKQLARAIRMTCKS